MPPTGELTGNKPLWPDEAQLSQAVAWLITGATDKDIRDAIAAKWPDTDPRLLMLACLEYCRKHSHPDPDTVRGWVFLSARELYRKQQEIGEFSGALRTLREILALASD